MGNLQDIVYGIIFLGVLVTVHESGHFFAAKWAGVKVLKFSIGFGQKLFGFRRGETEYVVAWIPLGGYVRMAGELPGDEVSEEERPRMLTSAPWWKRVIISFAGPAFNLIFPLIAYFFYFHGDHTGIAPRVGAVEPDLPAAIAGVRPGDLIKELNGEEIIEWNDITATMDGLYGRSVPVVVNRDGKDVTLTITPVKHFDEGDVGVPRKGLLGISASPRPPILGVAPGSVADAAGLKTFDRVLTVNGKPVRDELGLTRELASVTGPLTVVAVRSQLENVTGATLVVPELVTATVERQPGNGFAALGAESADLYLWTIFEGAPAEKAGLKPGDRLVAINDTPLQTWLMVTRLLTELDDKPFNLKWRSGGEEKVATITQVEKKKDELKKKARAWEFGARPRPGLQVDASLLDVIDPLAAGATSEPVVVHMGIQAAANRALHAVPGAIRQIGAILVGMMTGRISTDGMGGPIMLFKIASKSAEAGLWPFVANMAMVSVNLGLVNLLPIPIFDGFAILSACWEGIRRRPISMRAREVANLIGLVMIAMLVVLVFKNDIQRFFINK